VVKADGLAGGKGVFVPDTVDEASEALSRLMRARELGKAGERVVLEERLRGEEASFHVVCDGSSGVVLAPAQDHKRVHDGDRGPNTGGMGAYAPAPIIDGALRDQVLRDIVAPTLEGMIEEGSAFRGVLFVGLMIQDGRPYVLEYNVRFGDPEATVVVPTYDGDFFELLDSAARGRLSGMRISEPRGSALSVVMAASGYPGEARTGDPIQGLDADLPAGTFVMHAGTRRTPSGEIVTAGGRVLAVGALAPTLGQAASQAYEAVAEIRWAGEHHRRDIGHRALND
jgi:phosphoribosylamine--glycine ligase